MSLNKAIEHNKEHRKKYHGAKAIDHTCRNHGSCPACQMNRQRKNLKRKQSANLKLKEFFGGNKNVQE